MHSWMNPALMVRPSLLGGSGVFAVASIARGETLIVLGGRIIDIETENRLNEWQLDKPIEISDDYAFCPMTPAEMALMPQHYVNHSCDPNSGFRYSNFLIAIRDIQPNEEIAYDYAMILAANSRSENTFRMKCRCNSTLCRGVVTEEDWRDPRLQQRYAGYFSAYIEDKILTNKRGR